MQLQPILGKDADTTATAILETWIYKFGVPKHIVTDGGMEFCNALIEKIWDKLGVDHNKTTPYWPRANGQVEVFNKTMDHYLSTMLGQTNQSTVNWRMFIGPLMFSYNTGVNKAIKMAPFKALLEIGRAHV